SAASTAPLLIPTITTLRPCAASPATSAAAFAADVVVMVRIPACLNRASFRTRKSPGTMPREPGISIATLAAAAKPISANPTSSRARNASLRFIAYPLLAPKADIVLSRYGTAELAQVSSRDDDVDRQTRHRDPVAAIVDCARCQSCRRYGDGPATISARPTLRICVALLAGAKAAEGATLMPCTLSCCDGPCHRLVPAPRGRERTARGIEASSPAAKLRRAGYAAIGSLCGKRKNHRLADVAAPHHDPRNLGAASPRQSSIPCRPSAAECFGPSHRWSRQRLWSR